MPRKSDQQLAHEEQHRLWMGKLRKARTLKHQLAIQKVITGIEAKMYPDPIEGAREAAKVAKLQIKAQKVAAAEAKKAGAAELERLKEVERQKIRDEANPVLDHVKRAVIRATIRETTAVADQVPDITPSVEVMTARDANPQEAITAPEPDAQPADGVVLSPEMATITKAAEQSAKRHSGTKQDDMLELLRMATQPLESRDVIAPARRFLADSESSGPAETFARLGGYNNAPEPQEPVESGYLAEWNWTPKKW